MKTFFAIFLLGVTAYAQEASPPEPVPNVTPPALVEPVASTPADQSVIPQSYPRARYETTWAKNPFLLKVAAPVQIQENMWKDWALAGMFNNQGKIRVTIQNKQTGETQRLTNDGDAKGEFHLIKANFNRDRTKASVEVGRGSETGELKYDETLLAKPLSVAQANRTGAVPGQQSPPGAAGRAGGPPGQNNVAQMLQNRRAGLVMPGQGQPPGGNNSAANMQGGGAVSAQTGLPLPATNNDNALGGVNPSVNVPVTPNSAGAIPPTVSRRRLLIPPGAPTQ